MTLLLVGHDVVALELDASSTLHAAVGEVGDYEHIDKDPE